MNTIVSLIDHKKEVKYWIEALSNENISSKNKELINKALERELNMYLYPSITPMGIIGDVLPDTK